MSTYVLGIDGGTESLRARIFDLSGRSLGDHAAPYAIEFPAPSHAEQDPEAWWDAASIATRAAIVAAGVDPADIAALACDTTSCTVVALDEAGTPVRPCLLWMDVRAHREAADVLATGDPALRINGGGAGPVSPEWMIPKALWIKRHQPDVWARTTKVGEYQDFMTLRLTGRWVASLNNMTMRWHYQTQHGGWPDALLARLDLSDLRDKWPDAFAAPGDVIGPLTANAAKHLGLPETCQVVQGGADAFIGMIGLGVTQPGDLALITGSSHLQLGVAIRETHARGVWGTYADCVYPGRYIIEGGQTSTGSIIAWYKRNFAPDASYDELNAAAATLPPGSEGLLALDHFQGNRTPHTDALARGAVTGLTLKHTRAHVYRALIESICLGTRAIVDAFGTAFEARRIVVAGGAVNAPFWLQIHADTLGIPLEVTEQPEAPCLGAAILAAVGAGAYPDIDTACAAMVRTARVIKPDMDAHAAYDPIFSRYQAAFGALKQIRE